MNDATVVPPQQEVQWSRWVDLAIEQQGTSLVVELPGVDLPLPKAYVSPRCIWEFGSSLPALEFTNTEGKIAALAVFQAKHPDYAVILTEYPGPLAPMYHLVQYKGEHLGWKQTGSAATALKGEVEEIGVLSEEVYDFFKRFCY